MFVQDKSDNRRVLIVDISGLFYKYAFGGASRLSATLTVDGVPQVVDTTLTAYSIKTLHRWAKNGYYPLVVCFDSAGANNSRKAYFARYAQETGGQAVGYKESRSFGDDTFYKGVNLTANLLRQGGVCVLQGERFEADDLIKAAVDKAKQEYPGLPIDIVTGDQDLIPLVDDQVSVFISSRRTTFAESKEIEKVNYFQLRPYNLQAYVESLSEFKNLSIPYNAVLLKKLLRGKKADDVPGYPKFTPTKFNKLIAEMQEDGHDFSDLFRYGTPIKEVVYRGTEEVIPPELVASVPDEQKMLKFRDPVELTKMCNVLSDYLDEDIIRHIRFVYNGVNLNGAFVDVPERFKRRPAVVTAKIDSYLAGELQRAVSPLQIHLPTV